MKQKTTYPNLATALCAAQQAMDNPKYDAVNPHFRNRYASLKAVRAAVIPPLNGAGIAVIQSIVPIVGGVACETHLIHESGEQMKFGPLPVPSTKQDAQGYGSAITYACRYALCAICGVTGEDDDDAEKAVDRSSQAQATKPLFVKQNNDLATILEKAKSLEMGAATVKQFLMYKKAWPEGVNSVEELDAKTLSKILANWAQVIEFSGDGDLE
jgi:hypothetical protein